MNEVKCVEVIISSLTRRGTGDSSLSPVRCVTQVFTKDGQFIAENDPFTDDKFVLMDMVHFARYCIANKLTENKITPNTVKNWMSLPEQP